MTFFPCAKHGFAVVIVDDDAVVFVDAVVVAVCAVIVIVFVVLAVTASAPGSALLVVTPALTLGTNKKTKTKMSAHRSIIFLECSCTRFGTRFGARFGRDLV